MTSGPTILLIDDHALFRSGLAMVLVAGIAGGRVTEAASIHDALRQDGGPPQLVLLDIQLQGLNGLDGLALIRREWPLVPVLLLSSHTDAEKVRQALALGAAAYLSLRARCMRSTSRSTRRSYRPASPAYCPPVISDAWIRRRPPEVEYDLGADDEPLEPQAESRTFTRRFADRSGIELSPSANALRRAVPATIPFKAIAITLATLFVVVRWLKPSP